MKYYKDAQNTVYAFADDGSEDAFIKPELVAITSQQADALRSPVIVPSIITMRQARLALLQGGYLTQADALIAAMTGSDGDAARITWQYAATVERSHPLVAAIATELTLTSTQIDSLFTLGASL